MMCPCLPVCKLLTRKINVFLHKAELNPENLQFSARTERQRSKRNGTNAPVILFLIILFWVFLFVQPETRKEKRSDISSGRDGFHPLCEDVQMSSIVVNLVGGIPSMHLGQDWEFNLSILLTSKRISDKASSSVLRLEQVLDEWDSFYDIKFECELSFRDSFWCIST